MRFTVILSDGGSVVGTYATRLEAERIADLLNAGRKPRVYLVRCVA